MSWPTVGDTRQREPKGKGAYDLLCALKLSGERTTVGEFSGETPVSGAPKGEVRRGAGNLSGKRTELDLLKTDYASVIFYGSC